ncbi:hypothetical protein [Lactiplantibacillus fabifermentans]|uniref:hypothetical protein n=1 Tax=Lactiplantibacillus fabifermentans TaxID=483011 RepID=UPI0004BA083D|nr:hypothetical protein [Lactiplantibacillus fabifermentans]
MNLMTSGHPILASTVRITKNDYQKNRTPWTKRGDYLINHPIVTETGAKIDEFSIQQHGIFYTATQNYRASFWALGSQQGLSNSWLLPQLADRNGTGPSLRGGLESRL